MLCLFLIAGLSACSDNSATSERESNSTVIDHQIKALDKAKDVEAQILNAAEQQRALIDSQSQ